MSNNQNTTEEIKMTVNPAKASVAWRNNGEVAPITVRFLQLKERQGMTFQQRAIANSLGVKTSLQQTYLMHYTEKRFTELYGEFGFTADDITMPYRDEDGEITAVTLNIPSEDLFDEPYYISRYETTDTSECFNEDGLMKGWGIKQVNDVTFTHKGKTIYATNILTDDGVDYKLENDQDGNGNLKGKVADSKAKTKSEVSRNENTNADLVGASELDAISETQPDEVEEKEDVSFEF